MAHACERLGRFYSSVAEGSTITGSLVRIVSSSSSSLFFLRRFLFSSAFRFFSISLCTLRKVFRSFAMDSLFGSVWCSHRRKLSEQNKLSKRAQWSQPSFNRPQSFTVTPVPSKTKDLARRSIRDYSQSFMAAKPVCVREYPPLNLFLTNSFFSVKIASGASFCLRLGPEKHSILSGFMRNCRKVRNTRRSDVDNKILSHMICRLP